MTLFSGSPKRLQELREPIRSDAARSQKDRSAQRYFRIMLTASSAACSKAVSVAVQLAMVPLMLSYLGDYRYGVWLTLQSVIGFGAFADLGIGNGAMNAISTANAQKDSLRVARLVSSALIMLAALALLGLSIIICSLRYATSSGLSTEAAGLASTDLAGGIAVFAAYFALSLPFGFIERVNAAYQEGTLTNICRSGVAIASLLATSLVVAGGGTFTSICIATLLPQLVGWTLVWLVEFRRRPFLVPKISMFDSKLAKALLGVGVMFLGIQILSAFVFSMDTLLISWINGPEMVSVYGVQARVFSLVGTVTAMALTPLWPAYADAAAHGDHDWIKTTLKRSLIGSAAVVTPLAVGTALSLPVILRVWTDGRIETTPLLAFGLAAATVCQSICAALAMFWNGTSSIRLQFLMGVVLVSTSLPVKAVALSRYGIQPIGVITASMTLLVVLVPAYFLVRTSLGSELPSATPTP